MQRILITGARGVVGSQLRPGLRRPGRVLRLLDLAPQEPAEPGEQVELITGSFTDPGVAAVACRDVDAVIHLGGISREASWPDVLRTNIDGAHTLLEAARRAGVRRVILASSNHVVGYRTAAEAGADGLPADSTPRPDTFYGVSKAAIEALGSLYHSRFNLDVTVIRIGWWFPEPRDLRTLSLWLSPEDGIRLLEACLTTPEPGYRLIWGVSANTRRLLSLREAEGLGYRSSDDAERFAEALLGEAAKDGGTAAHLGGEWLDAPLGEPNPL